MGRVYNGGAKAAALLLLAGSAAADISWVWPSSFPTDWPAHWPSPTAAAAAATTTTATASPSTSTPPPLTTFTPCSWCPASVSPAVINVTSQLYPLSTCSAATSACWRNKCYTEYPYSTWLWVSTTIPCHVNGTASPSATAQSCVVTSTQECVTVSDFLSTSTSTSFSTWTVTTTTSVTVDPTAWKRDWEHWGTGASADPTATSTSTADPAAVEADSAPTPIVTASPVVEVIISPVLQYTTISRDYCAPFQDIGPLALPGFYDGPGLCTTCGAKGAGLTQGVTATDCRTGSNFTATTCVTYTETWISEPAPPATTQVAAALSTGVWAPTDGTYTWTFTETIPAQTTGGATYPSTYWNWPVTTVHTGGPTTIWYTTTVTTVITVTSGPTTSRDPPAGGWPTDGGWGDWSSTSTAQGNPTGPGSPGGPPTTGQCSFNIKVVDNNGKWRKRSNNWLGFSDGDGVQYSGRGKAATFVYEDGQLQSDGQYIGTDSGNAYIPFEKSTTQSNSHWSVGRHVSLESSAYSLGHGKALFCVTADNTPSLFIEFTEHPPFQCNEVLLEVVPGMSLFLFVLALKFGGLGC